ncbi:MAG: 4Fe-4S dicluster domain-containing protein, partial [bacterium]
MRTTDYLDFLPAEIISDLDQVRPVITEQCIGCPVCEVVCPHHVFHREETDKAVRFLIVEKQCTGCMKCMSNCLFDGVTLESASERTVRVVELAKQRCSDCKEEFYGRKDACPRCRMAGSRGLF